MGRFKDALAKPGTNIIAEIKYSSPSHGPFACKLKPADVATIYRDNGAAAISVLTEAPRFRGKLEYLREASEIEDCPPLLRKDFIKTRPQVKEALDFGASAYLLIVRDLAPDALGDLMAHGLDIGIDPLVEVHDPFELEKALAKQARLIGVNNRNLTTLEVDVKTCFKVARMLERERGLTLVAESGIEDRSLILELQDAGFNAFLIGSAFMDSSDPGKKLRELRGEA